MNHKKSIMKVDYKEQQSYNRELDRIYQHDWWMAFWTAIKQRGREHENYFWTLEIGPLTISYRWLARHFYTFKAIICLILGRYNGPDIDVYAVNDVAIWDYGGPYGEYSSYEWKTLEVGQEKTLKMEK